VVSAEEEAVVAAGRLAECCLAVLGASVVSSILHGSLTLADFQPGKSDLDLLLVVDRGLTGLEIDALVSAVGDAGLGPANGIDLLVVTRAAAAFPGDGPSRELQVGRHGPGDELEVEGRADRVFDLWPELSMARATGRALSGPDPHEIIAEVPVDTVHASGMHC
jgi:hypothetical protein